MQSNSVPALTIKNLKKKPNLKGIPNAKQSEAAHEENFQPTNEKQDAVSLKATDSGYPLHAEFSRMHLRAEQQDVAVPETRNNTTIRSEDAAVLDDVTTILRDAYAVINNHECAGGATAIRLEERQRRAAELGLTLEQEAAIRHSFELFDKNGTGLLELEDVKLLLRLLGVRVEEKAFKLAAKRLRQSELGRISYNDYMKLMSVHMSDGDIENELSLLFAICNSSSSSKIPYGSFQNIVNILHQRISGENAPQLEISPHDFTRMMRKTLRPPLEN